ncbi:EcsC family protein [Massilia antarctica]|uniref:EcsC family protein n=1 Tax=Massilia antarctica TaxID=2765360 RepID=UPI0006BB5A5E|nr:EcsC family protein [Massilia sp. H27-R4]MCY0914320.1 EcsC family protein [Massilia sp. H27-R4]CUI08735.1 STAPHYLOLYTIC protease PREPROENZYME LASA [Janthinobacterium sp. CG23_2]CUU32521.1 STAPHYLOLYTIC protease PREPROENZYME LASA [Janthinobacterium sp. CG23_2]
MEREHPAGSAPRLSQEHLEQLQQAKRLLEHPGYVARITDVIGMPLEAAVKALPAAWTSKIAAVTNASLTKCLNVANATLRPSGTSSFPKLHSAAVALSGAAGGAFGIAGLALELPVSTVVMLRSIADIGRSQGENLASGEAQLACLMVFSLGGKTAADDASESGYYAARIALAQAMSEATVYLAKHSLANESAPALVRLIAQIATRFNVHVSQKAAAMMVPIIGAAGGALVNTLFINHFQDMARGHFTVRRLERLYGPDSVSAAYLQLQG